MALNALTIVAPDPRVHAEQLYDLIPKVFSNLGYFRGRDLCRQAYVGQSHYDWAASRIGLLNGTIVTHYGVWGYDMRIGQGRVRVAGIGAVATHGDYRKRGFMDQTAQAAVAGMSEHGYAMTILFGIENFYHRFGYVRAWSETDWYVKVTALPSAPVETPVRAFRPMPRPEFAALYNAYYATCTGTAVRPTFRRLVNFANTPLQGYRWDDAAGQLAGYVIVHRQGARLECIEYCGDVEQTLRVLGHLGRRLHCDEVKFVVLPQTSPLATRLRRESCRSETQYQRCGGAMVRTVSLRRTLAGMVNAFSDRITNSPFAAWSGRLQIEDAREQVVLQIEQGTVTVAVPGVTPHCLAGGEAVVQLLIGTAHPEEVLDSQGITTTGEARRLVATLFPAQYPQLSYFDRY